MDTPLVEELKREEQSLLLRLERVRATLDIYRGGQWTEPMQVSTPLPELPTGYPPLDDMRTRDAINLYLNWAQDQGRSVTLGELERVLLAHRVVSFRGKPFSESRFSFKTLTNIIGSPDNKDLWQVEMHSPEHYQRADTIALKSQHRVGVQG
jgi:hypothetical protein